MRAGSQWQNHRKPVGALVDRNIHVKRRLQHARKQNLRRRSVPDQAARVHECDAIGETCRRL
jgi:ribosomal protein S8E